jgi:hypothetical protein
VAPSHRQVTRRIVATAFKNIGPESLATWSTDNSGAQIMNGTSAGYASFVYALDDLPIDTEIDQIRWQSNVTAVSIESVTIELRRVQDSNPGNFISVSQSSTRSGSWTIDTVDLTQPGYQTHRVIETNTTYYLCATGYWVGGGAWALSWVEFTYTLPPGN